MGKLIILRGIPGSGKSTFARKLIKLDKTSSTIIVNRDDLRSMCGKYWVSTREALISEFEEFMVAKALEYNYNVILDATNLNTKTIKKFESIAYKYNITIKHIVLKINPIKAYIRILYRTLMGGRYIKYSVIKGFYNRYLNIISTK